MRKKTFWGGLAILAGLYAVRMGLKLSGELKRYNHILSLSNEGTVQEETPELMLQVMKQQKQTIKEWVTFVQAIPKDVVRYLKIETM
jgi:hypothetical protein